MELEECEQQIDALINFIEKMRDNERENVRSALVIGLTIGTVGSMVIGLIVHTLFLL